jgi:tellurite resistance protein
MGRWPQKRRASVCGSAAGRFASASLRQTLLSALRSTFPARLPQTEAEYRRTSLEQRREYQYDHPKNNMSWRGTIRAIQAAERRAHRDAQRRFKELQRRTKEQAKLSTLEQARLEVETYENRVDVLLSIHKEQGDEWNWEQILNAPPPVEPVRGNRHATEVEARRLAYVPGFFDKLFGKANKQTAAFEVETQFAQARDEREFQEAWSQFQRDYAEWEDERKLAAAVLTGDQEAYVRVLRELSPFAELSELGSSLNFSIHSPKLLEVLVKVSGEQAIPSQVKSLTSSGKVSSKAMPKGRFHEIYQDYVCGCVLRVGRESFGLLPVETVIVTALADLFDSSTGRTTEQPILSVAIPRAVLNNLNFSCIDPSDAMENFLHRGEFKASRKSGAFAPVTPLVPKDLSVKQIPAPITAEMSSKAESPECVRNATKINQLVPDLPPTFISSVFSCGEPVQGAQPPSDNKHSLMATVQPSSVNPFAVKWAEALRRNEIQLGFLRLTANELAEILGRSPQDNFTLPDSKALARMVEASGYSLEPDPRHGAGNFWGNREIGIFQPPSGTIQVPSDNFLGASALLQLCLLVAAADGTVDHEELDQFLKFIEGHFHFTPDEHQRLVVLETLLARNATSAKVTLGRTAKRVPQDKHIVIAQFLVDVAAADGVISPKEHKALTRIFEALGLSTDTLATLIRNLAASGSEVVIQTAEVRVSGEAILPRTAEEALPAGLKLDMARVAAISAETHEVIGLLAKAMAEEDGNNELDSVPRFAPASTTTVTKVSPTKAVGTCTSNVAESKLESLDAKWHPIVQRLGARDTWSRVDFDALAREHRFMPLSVFDAINEWADEHLGDFLLEGEDSITVHRTLLSN